MFPTSPAIWPAAGSVDTEIGCFRRPEARDAEAKVEFKIEAVRLVREA
jgi:hypothetical protein